MQLPALLASKAQLSKSELHASGAFFRGGADDGRESFAFSDSFRERV